MDEDQFNERATRLLAVSKIVEQVPAEIRSEAFGLLKNYVTGEEAQTTQDSSRALGQADNENIDTDLFTRFDHDKPADNAKLIAAYFFQEYGSQPFSVDDVKEMAARVGITIPERVDMTFANALENGKQLFTKAGRGRYRPTVHGEAYMKTTYEVKKGTKNPESVEESGT